MNSIQCYLKKHGQVYLRLDLLQVDLLASGAIVAFLGRDYLRLTIRYLD